MDIFNARSREESLEKQESWSKRNICVFVFTLKNELQKKPPSKMFSQPQISRQP